MDKNKSGRQRDDTGDKVTNEDYGFNNLCIIFSHLDCLIYTFFNLTML